MNDTSAVIFDMDGVIVNSNPAHKKAIQQFCKNHNQEVTQTFLENRLYGRMNAEWIPELFGTIETHRLTELANEKEQLFRDIFSPQDHIVDGIIDFMDSLHKQGITMAVATSAPTENADYILNTLSIKHYFRAILDDSHVDTGKPDPEIYLKAAHALNKKTENCIVFEDSVSGVKAGRAAGCTVIGLTTTHTKKELGDCSVFIDNFTEQQLHKIMPIING
ncbi:MAG TPA: HAD family phosphatase [Fodinibius sp.]|nr:HAD family phosphatase [Fodinibius sp.]